MAGFKLCIADPKTGKCYQKEAKDAEANLFIGLNVGENVSGDSFGMPGYEFTITGGSDYCGFPMRHGILGLRKKIYSYGGVGFPGLKKGQKKRKTVCGHKIHEKITQINIKIIKEGAKKIEEHVPAGKKKEGAEAEPERKEKPKEERKEKPKEERKEKPKEERKEKPKEERKEKPKEERKEKPKEEDPKEERENFINLSK